MSAPRAPEPPGLPWLGHVLPFRRDVLGLLTSARARYGDLVRFHLGPIVLHVAAHPDLIRQVLVERTDRYDKETRSSRKIRGLTGMSLLTANGREWQRRRRLIQPAFRPEALAALLPRMSQAIAERRGAWREHAAARRPLDLSSEMARLTFTLVGRALFSSEVGGEAAPVEQAMAVLLPEIYHRFERLVDLPKSWPTPGRRRFAKALADVDRMVYRILGERQKGAEAAAGDLLDRLLAERGEGEGDALSERELRNETLTLLLAGHETTANALAFTGHLLALHPEAQEVVRQEVEQILGGREPTYAELAALPATERTFREAMRIYPPIWAIERRAVADDELGGFSIPAGSSVIVSPWVTHRHPEFWRDPERFDPDRFTPERAAGRPPLAYLPFGAGPRFCIGGHFAMVEAMLILVHLLREFRLRPAPDPPVVPRAGITLRPKAGVQVLLEEAG